MVEFSAPGLLIFEFPGNFPSLFSRVVNMVVTFLLILMFRRVFMCTSSPVAREAKKENAYIVFQHCGKDRIH